jgi:hypothetical protein
VRRRESAEIGDKIAPLFGEARMRLLAMAAALMLVAQAGAQEPPPETPRDLSQTEIQALEAERAALSELYGAALVAGLRHDALCGAIVSPSVDCGASRAARDSAVKAYDEARAAYQAHVQAMRNTIPSELWHELASADKAG